MEKVAFTLSSSLLDRVDKKVGKEYDNRSEALRDIIEKGLRYDSRVNSLEARVDEITKTAKQTSKMKGETKEIVEKTEGLMKYMERRRRIMDQASILKKLKWKVFGFNETTLLDNNEEK